MIGDVLASSILFEVLKTELPNAELHYVVNLHTIPVLENNPFIDKLIVVTPEIEKSKLKFWKFLNLLKNEKYDTVIDVYSKMSSNLITLFSGAKTKISKQKWYTSFIYTNTFEEQRICNTNKGLAIANRLQLLKPICNTIPKSISPKIYLTPREIAAAKQFLVQSSINLSQPLFMISVLGSHLNKTYPSEYMAKLIDSIVGKTQGQILFNYIPKQEKEAKTVYDFCKDSTKKHIYFNVFGKNLRDFLAITKHCSAVIGNEGGAINMAKAINIPTFTIFSPWIIKEAWNTLEDDKIHVAVHLKDYNSELFKGRSLKELKENTFNLYQQFLPETITPKLKQYLQQF